MTWVFADGDARNSMETAMSELSFKAVAAARDAKAKRLGAANDPKQKVDASSWTPPEPLDTEAKTGLRPVSRRAFKRGGKVGMKAEGAAAAKRADRKPRKAGGSATEIAEAKVNRNVKDANAKFGKPHIGGYNRGGRPRGNPSADPGMERDITRGIPGLLPTRPAEENLPQTRPSYEEDVTPPRGMPNMLPRSSAPSYEEDMTPPRGMMRKHGGRAKKADGGNADPRVLAAQSNVPSSRMGFQPTRSRMGQMLGAKKGGKISHMEWEHSKEDLRQDKKLAKKHGMSMEAWEKSKLDEKHDRQQSTKGLKKGGRIAKRGGGPLDIVVEGQAYNPEEGRQVGRPRYEISPGLQRALSGVASKVAGRAAGVIGGMTPTPTAAQALTDTPEGQAILARDRASRSTPVAQSYGEDRPAQDYGEGRSPNPTGAWFTRPRSSTRSAPRPTTREMTADQLMGIEQDRLARNASIEDTYRPGLATFKRGGSTKEGNYTGGTRPTGGRIARASGGSLFGTKKPSKGKGKTNIVISINAGQPQQQAAMPPGPPRGMPVPVPPPMPPGGAPGGAPGAAMMPPPGGMPPMPMPPPGGPAGGPPGMPPIARKAGGRIYPKMHAGAGSGEGRLEKIEAYGLKPPARKAGGRIYPKMHAGAGSGEGRLEKIEAYGLKPPRK